MYNDKIKIKVMQWDDWEMICLRFTMFVIGNGSLVHPASHLARIPFWATIQKWPLVEYDWNVVPTHERLYKQYTLGRQWVETFLANNGGRWCEMRRTRSSNLRQFVFTRHAWCWWQSQGRRGGRWMSYKYEYLGRVMWTRCIISGGHSRSTHWEWMVFIFGVEFNISR